MWLGREYGGWKRHCRKDTFLKELEKLKRSQRLCQISRFLVLNLSYREGFMRLRGLLDRTNLPYDNWHLVILLGRHPSTRKIIRAFRIQHKYHGTDFLLDQIRQYFWLTQGRQAVKKMKQEYHQCYHQYPINAGCLNVTRYLSEISDSLPYSNIIWFFK